MKTRLKLVPYVEEEETLQCGFCGKNEEEVEVLFAGPVTNICNECTELCMKLLQERTPQNPEYRFKNLSEEPIG